MDFHPLEGTRPNLVLSSSVPLNGRTVRQAVRNLSRKSDGDKHFRIPFMAEKTPKRITSEKPISLHPLKFEDAVSALLKVKPEPKATKKSNKSVQKMDKV